MTLFAGSLIFLSGVAVGYAVIKNDRYYLGVGYVLSIFGGLIWGLSQ